MEDFHLYCYDDLDIIALQVPVEEAVARIFLAKGRYMVCPYAVCLSMPTPFLPSLPLSLCMCVHECVCVGVCDSLTLLRSPLFPPPSPLPPGGSYSLLNPVQASMVYHTFTSVIKLSLLSI